MGRDAYALGDSTRGYPLPAWAARFAELGGGELDRWVELGELVRKRRGRWGLREVAEETGVSPSTLSRAENGKSPAPDDLRRICAWLGLDPAPYLAVSDPARPQTISREQALEALMQVEHEASEVPSPISETPRQGQPETVA